MENGLHDTSFNNDEAVSGKAESHRPIVSLATARELVERLYGLNVVHIRDLYSYDDMNYFVEVADEHHNPYIDQMWSHGFVLKILNSRDSMGKHFGGYMCLCR